MDKNKNTYLSLFALIVSNLFPIIGVLYFDWNIKDILILYWFETAIIGFFGILRILLLPTSKKHISMIGLFIKKMFHAIFFTLQFSIYMIVDLGLLFVIFNISENNLIYDRRVNLSIINVKDILFIMAIPTTILFLSNLFSFIKNYPPKEELKSISPNNLMSLTNQKSRLMHIGIILGSLLFIFLKVFDTFWILFTIILLKTTLDLISHLKFYKYLMKNESSESWRDEIEKAENNGIKYLLNSTGILIIVVPLIYILTLTIKIVPTWTNTFSNIFTNTELIERAPSSKVVQYKRKTEKRFDGPIIGSVDHNGELSSGIHPCVSDINEAKIILNQLISYNKCQKDNLKCVIDIEQELLNISDIEKNFVFSQEEDFFKINKIGNTYDYYLMNSSYPNNIPEIFYICDSNYLEYINTLYGNRHRYIRYFPYNITPVAFEESSRALSYSYLNDKSVGVAKVSENQNISLVFLIELFDLLYELDYFEPILNVKNIEIIRKNFTYNEFSLNIQDEILVKNENTTFPYEDIETTYRFSLRYNKKSRVVISEIEVLD